MIAFHPIYVHPLPENHRFPMEKYDLLPRQLLHEGTVQQSDFIEPESLRDEDVLAVHDSRYLERLQNLEITEKEQRISGFVHSKRLIEREICIMEGTRKAASLALNTGIAFNIAGGTHHAFENRGEGFCLLNDQVIAASWLLRHQKVKKILIIDLDVHQGNGTACMLQNEQRVFTFSMHGDSNYPLKKERSDLDVGLADGTNDVKYLYLLEKNLNSILQKFIPEFVFYQCGVDILESDKLGKLNVSPKGCLERDKIVFEIVRQLGVPVVCSMGGGYSPQIKDIVEAHANTFRAGLCLLT